MSKLMIMISAAVFILVSCSSLDYSALDDPRSYNSPELTQEATEVKEYVIQEAVFFEDFNDTRYTEGLSVAEEAELREGYLFVDDANRPEGGWFSYGSEEGFTSLFVCSKVTGSTGHVFLVTDTADGHIDLFHDVLGDWTQILNSPANGGTLRFDSPSFGEPRSQRFRLYELKIEEGEVIALVNGKELGRYAAPSTQVLHSIHVSSNDGGAGMIDYIAAK